MRRPRSSPIRALFLLTGAMLQRLAREGLILRSLAFPTILIVGTLVLTIGLVAWIRWEPTIALAPDIADIAPLLDANHMKTVVSEDPQAMVQEGAAWGGVEGNNLWLAGGGPQALILESTLRQRLGAEWRPDADVPRPAMDVARAMGQRIVILLGVLFALYGVVFGAGMVARDRDSGTLEIELALPLPRWIHGLARLLTGTVALSGFLAMGILMVNAVIGLPDVGATLRHGVASASGSTSIGLLVIGRGGLQNGFTGPLTSGMTLATGLIAVGLTGSPIARWLPLASFGTDASGWEALTGALVLGVVTVWVFTVRATKA